MYSFAVFWTIFKAANNIKLCKPYKNERPHPSAIISSYEFSYAINMHLMTLSSSKCKFLDLSKKFIMTNCNYTTSLWHFKEKWFSLAWIKILKSENFLLFYKRSQSTPAFREMGLKSCKTGSRVNCNYIYDASILLKRIDLSV